MKATVQPRKRRGQNIILGDYNFEQIAQLCLAGVIDNE